MAISDKELWACAAQVLKQYGDDAHRHIAERIGALALEGDMDGVEVWKAIAYRFDQLAFSDAQIADPCAFVETGADRRQLLADPGAVACPVRASRPWHAIEKVLGHGHPWTKATASVKAAVLAALGREDEAAAVRAKYGLGGGAEA